jgi:hypothetical protein
MADFLSPKSHAKFFGWKCAHHILRLPSMHFLLDSIPCGVESYDRAKAPPFHQQQHVCQPQQQQQQLRD